MKTTVRWILAVFVAWTCSCGNGDSTPSDAGQDGGNGADGGGDSGLESAYPLQLGGAYTDYGKDVATDSAGNVYLAGYFQDSLDFNPAGEPDERTASGDPQNPGSVDTFLAKYDPLGHLLWVRAFSGPGATMPHSLLVEDGQVTVTGYTGSPTTLEGDPLTLEANVGRDVLLARYDTDGNPVWAFALGDPEPPPMTADDPRYEDGFDLDSDAQGNLYLVGTFSGSIDLDPAESGETRHDSVVDDQTGDPSRDLFVASYNPDGQYRWSFVLGGPGRDHAHGIRVLNDGSIVVAGFFSTSMDFDPSDQVDQRTSVGGFDAFLARFDPERQLVWARVLAGPGNDQFRPGALDLSGQGGSATLLTGGDFTGTVDFNPGGEARPMTSAGQGDMFLARYDLNGGLVWVRGVAGDQGTDFVHRIEEGIEDRIYTTGQIVGAVDFDPDNPGGEVSTTGRTDSFVACYSAQGEFMWAEPIGGNGDPPEVGTGLAADSWVIYATGKFTGTADLNPLGESAMHTGAGAEDVYLLRIEP